MDSRGKKILLVVNDVATFLWDVWPIIAMVAVIVCEMRGDRI